MRSHCAVYVDVGYLLASVATRVAGTSLRSAVVISYPDLVTRLVEQAEQLSGLPVLRLNWYDAGSRGSAGPSKEQDQIGMLPRVKLRLGRTSPNGEQKGVDLRIGLDLVSHGHGRAVDVIYLVSGDDDLTEAVEEAQSLGVQVVILAVPDRHGKPYAVSHHLIRESDGIVAIDPDVIDATVHVRQRADEPTPSGPAGVSAAGAAPGPDTTGSDESGAAAPEEASTQPGATTAVPSAPSPNGTAASLPGAAAAANGAGAARPGPTPADLAKRPRQTTGTSSAPVAPPPLVPAPALVWSSRTGGESGAQGHLTDGERVDIAEIGRSVVTTWASTASESDRRRLIAERPYVPSDLDRTLLMDLSARLGVYDIGDEQRSALRQEFWDVVDELLT